jgi:putative endonuclease
MLNRHQLFGKQSESAAVRHLKKKGYKILEKNYRTPLGEIDIVARDNDTIVFVEVKARSSARFGNPKTAVTPRKQRRISMVALHYLKEKRQHRAKARFDVIAITSDSSAPQIELVKNAFELAYT